MERNRWSYLWPFVTVVLIASAAVAWKNWNNKFPYAGVWRGKSPNDGFEIIEFRRDGVCDIGISIDGVTTTNKDIRKCSYYMRGNSAIVTTEYPVDRYRDRKTLKSIVKVTPQNDGEVLLKETLGSVYIHHRTGQRKITDLQKILPPSLAKTTLHRVKSY